MADVLIIKQYFCLYTQERIINNNSFELSYSNYFGWTNQHITS